MKTPKELVESYAHDYRDMTLSQEGLEKMLWEFWNESEKGNRHTHLEQFMSRIDSQGFKEWYFKS